MARDDYKTRNWVTIVYPDSAPDGWRDKLREECIQALVSPLHAADVNADETQKKAHWHVMLMFDGPKRASMAENIIKEIGGVGCKPCNSVRGYARYLCHLDNPEKAQYDIKDVECFGGVDYVEMISLPTDLHRMMKDMRQWCRDTGCISYAQLCDYADEYREDWARALNTKCTVAMRSYVMALAYEREKGITKLKSSRKGCIGKSEKEIEAERQEQLEDLAFYWSLEEEMANETDEPAEAPEDAEAVEASADADEEAVDACQSAYQQGRPNEEKPRWRKLKEKFRRKVRGRKRR